MKRKLKFYKEDERWYADVPGVSKEDNEMVFGSDIFLEKISNGKPQVLVEFSNSDEDDAIYAFRMTDHDEYGASYCEVHNEDEPIWLCNVAHEIFIEHPAEIFITDVKADDFYEGRRCQHKATGHYYTIVGQGLMKMEDGLWYDSVVYRGENWKSADKKVTIFTKRLSDFNKEFNLL